MKSPLLFTVLLTLAFAPALVAQSTAPLTASDPLVGQWRWKVSNNSPAGTVEVRADGTVKDAGGQIGEWMFQRLSTTERRYIVVWGLGRYIDSIVLAADGKTLSGHNANDSIRAERVVASTSTETHYFGTK